MNQKKTVAIVLAVIILFACQAQAILLEGEDGVDINGISKIYYRSNASDGMTGFISEASSGDCRYRDWILTIPDGPKVYAIGIRYSNSNDEYCVNETIAVSIGINEGNLQFINEPFYSVDTGAGGEGWNQFKTDQIGSIEIWPGSYLLRLHIGEGDAWGFEIDYIEILPAQ